MGRHRLILTLGLIMVRRRMLKYIVSLVLFVSVLGCVEQQFMHGPVLEINVRVVKIIVEPLEENSEQKTVDDPIEIKEALGLFSEYSWQKNRDNPLLPLYKIELHKETGKYSTYWLGSYSNPPRFPCYWLCSGWWLAASGEDGNIDTSRYKSLASSSAMFGVTKLLENSLTM